MAITWANVTRMYRGPFSLVYAEATLDSSYAAGGETVTATDIGLTTIKALIPTATSGYDATYSKTNDASGKLAVYASLTPDTNSATSVPLDSSVGRDFSTLTISCLVIGNTG